MGNYDDFIVGGQITPEGKELGITEDDVVGGQLTPEARARLDAEAEATPKGKSKKK